MKFLKESETDNTMFLLYKVEYTEDTYKSFTKMATVMSNDPQYIQAVRKTSNKKYLSVINEGCEAMLMHNESPTPFSCEVIIVSASA